MLSVCVDGIFCSNKVCRQILFPELFFLWCHNDDTYLLLLTKRMMRTFTTITVSEAQQLELPLMFCLRNILFISFLSSRICIVHMEDLQKTYRMVRNVVQGFLLWSCWKGGVCKNGGSCFGISLLEYAEAIDRCQHSKALEYFFVFHLEDLGFSKLSQKVIAWRCYSSADTVMMA